MITTVNGTKPYIVDTDKLLCTCPHFRYRCDHLPTDNPDRLCKHLKMFVSQDKTRFTREYADRIISEHLSPILSKYDHTICGSYRRGNPTVGDIDVLISTDDLTPVADWVSERFTVLWSGSQKISFIVDKIQVDFRRSTKESRITLAMYFTGSKNENIRLRTIARRRGMKLNEYGLWKGGNMIKCESEEQVYSALGLEYVPPNLR